MKQEQKDLLKIYKDMLEKNTKNIKKLKEYRKEIKKNIRNIKKI